MAENTNTTDTTQLLPVGTIVRTPHGPGTVVEADARRVGNEYTIRQHAKIVAGVPSRLATFPAASVQAA